MSYLFLVRHGESLWNEKGLWTGLTDIGLSPKGVEESIQAGEKLKGFPIDCSYISSLKRARQTLNEIKKVLGKDFPTTKSKALDERDYGIYTGQNKWKIQKEVGKEKFKQLRRGWDSPIPEGETLKDVYNRVVPYYRTEILSKLVDGKNILIVAHGNSLRALVKYLENILDKDVEKLEIPTGAIYKYVLDQNGNIQFKEILNAS